MTFTPIPRKRTTVPPKATLEAYMGFLVAQAWKMHRASSMDVEDCKQAAVAEFYRVREFYGEDHPRFPILLKQSLFSRRTDMVKAAIKQRRVQEAAQFLAEGQSEEADEMGFKHVELRMTLASISKEAQEILQVVLNVPEEMGAPTLKSLTAFFKNKNGWHPRYILQCYEEIRGAFQP